ncbi:MAG TPA: transglycosylase SLT domain-containing protein [Capillimicrobium sp.]|nr:transglycosylase SLT domain-containing protein [Capillimicrobium sp.]
MRAPRLPLLLALAAAVLVVATLALRGGDGDPPPAVTAPSAGLPDRDPLAWTPERSGDYAARAAAGLAHPLYALTADGVELAAERTDALRDDVERAARAHGVDPDTLEAIVFLESAGRPEAQASDDLAGAVGLGQILAETATGLLDMRVDLAASRRITRRMVRAAERGDAEEVERLRAERREVDERFDPIASLDGAARYLAYARGELGRDDLAIASYHMGVGNLQHALELYGEGTVPYVQLFFDSTPTRHAGAWEFLFDLGDDSATYLWRVEAGREIMRLYREDPDRLAEVDALMNERNSAEVALHPADSIDAYDDADELDEAYADGELVPLPTAYLAHHGIRVDRRMGELASHLHRDPEAYRGLRREALATLAYIGASVYDISGAGKPLRVTSTVRDGDYQEALRGVNGEATEDYSLHTTGYAFDIARDYASTAQAVAFQSVLDRLTALNLIAWVREPGAIHVTVSADAARLIEPMGVVGAE